MKVRNWITDDTNLDVLWLLLKTEVAFALIRMICMNIRFFKGLIADAIQLAMFTYVIYQYVYGAAKKNHLTLNECYISKIRFGLKDFVVALLIIAAFNFGVSLFAKGIVATNVEMERLRRISISNFFRSGLASGINEELVFRGYLLKQIEEKKGRKWAAILSSLVFGLGHAMNGGMSPAEILWIVIGTGSFGMMLSVLTYETGTIWRGVLIHIFMNTKERFLGFNRESSLYLFEFPTEISQDMRSCIIWMAVSIISWAVVLGYWWKLKSNR